MKTECLLQILQKGPEQISLEVAEQLETKEIYLATGYTDYPRRIIIREDSGYHSQ